MALVIIYVHRPQLHPPIYGHAPKNFISLLILSKLNI